VPCPRTQQANLPAYFHTNPSKMLNVKQRSCEYQLLKYFGLTRPRNRTQVYWLQGECFCLQDCLYLCMVRLVATSGSLTRRLKRSLHCLMVKILWWINDYLNQKITEYNHKHWIVETLLKVKIIIIDTGTTFAHMQHLDVTDLTTDILTRLSCD